MSKQVWLSRLRPQQPLNRHVVHHFTGLQNVAHAERKHLADAKTRPNAQDEEALLRMA
jgi:hypothetical protein